jgi:hypothetical protein
MAVAARSPFGDDGFLSGNCASTPRDDHGRGVGWLAA